MTEESQVVQLWQPTNGIVMSNETGDNNMTEESTGCIALSKNEFYVMTTSRGKVSVST